MNYEKMFLDKYNYLYSNIDFVTRPHMSIIAHYEPEMLKAIENLLLSCDELENNYGYKYIEELKNNKKYLKKYKKALKENDIWDIIKLSNYDKCLRLYKHIYDILEEYPNSIDKHHKLLALDMYARYTRYQYDNIERKSGVYLNITELPDNFSGICKNVKSNDYFNSNVDFNDYIYNIYKLDLCKQKTLKKHS